MQGSDDGGNKVPRKEESSAAWKSTPFQEGFAPDPQHLSQNSPQTGGQIYDEAGSASPISANLIQEHPLRSSNALASFDGLQLSDQQQPASGRFDDPSYADLNEVLPKSVSSGLGEATSGPYIEGLSMHEIREKFLRGGKDTLHVSEIPPSPPSKPLYQPLSLVNRETRVIRILPEMEPDRGCSFFEPIRCSLEVISLDLNPRYHTLSYTWQDETLGDSFTYEPWPDEDIKVPIDGWIYLSNEKVKVTHNLWAALWHLRFLASWLQRDPDAPRVYSGRDSKSIFTFDIPIWIDALCINQSDISERNQQVPHMYSIYQNAELVHVWLGPAVADIDKMRNLIVELAKYPRTFEGHGDNRHKGPTNSSRGGKNADWFRESLKDKIFKPEFKTGWDAVMSALERPYWKRVWIIQELASNPNYKIYIGLQIIDLIALCAGFFKLSASTFFDQETILENLGEWAMSLFKSWATVAKFSEHQIAHSEPKFPGHSLVYLLDTYKGQKCSDPRDLVYGLF
ncbi:Heterokaryon incompatibility protein (HET) domain containing protein [Hyaloscypha variabilis]